VPPPPVALRDEAPHAESPKLITRPMAPAKPIETPKPAPVPSPPPTSTRGDD
jgi:hypothetical protein